MICCCSWKPIHNKNKNDSRIKGPLALWCLSISVYAGISQNTRNISKNQIGMCFHSCVHLFNECYACVLLSVVSNVLSASYRDFVSIVAQNLLSASESVVRRFQNRLFRKNETFQLSNKNNYFIYDMHYARHYVISKCIFI